MAYATIAGMPVQLGLYTCMVPLVVYALLGGSRALSVSTTSTIAVLVAATIATLPASQRSGGHLVEASATLTVLVGLCLLLMRLLRLGALVEIISPATLAGIRVGVGLTVAVSQLPALLGLPSSAESGGFFSRLADVVRHLSATDGVTVLVSAAALAVLILQRRLAPRLPGPLLVVAGGILLVATTSIEDRSDGHGVVLIGKVPTGFPQLTMPVPRDVGDLLPGAVAIAVMAFLETVLVARTNRRADEPAIAVNQELVATGAAAVLGGVTQSLPPAGGFSQSAVNLRSGARTQAAGVTTAALAVLVAMLLAPVLDDLPEAILAAMVLVAVASLLSPRDFVMFARLDPAELWVALVVAALGLTGGMLLGVAAGVGLTLALLVRSVNTPRVRPLYPRAGGGWTTTPPEPGQPVPIAAAARGAVLLHLDTTLYAGNAQATVDAVLAAVAAHPEASLVVLEGTAVRAVTVPMLQAFEQMATALEARGITLVQPGLPPSVRERLRRDPWFAARERAGLVVDTVEDALLVRSE